MKQTLDHNKEANKKQNIVENIEAQIDLNEILDQKKFLKNNIFEYDWCLEQKGQLLSQLTENLVWYIIDQLYFSLKTDNCIEELQSSFNQLTKINFPQNQMIQSQFLIETNLLLLSQAQNEDKTQLKQFLQNQKKTVPIQKIIDLLKNQKQEVETYLRGSFENIRQQLQFHQNLINQTQDIQQQDGIFHLKNEEEKYLEYLERKHINYTPEITQQKANKNHAPQDDILCLTCNDGDYSDQNLIVICSKCNISVHQKCYGIDSIPQDDWICDLCQEFKQEGKNMQCPFCPCKSGPMKITNLKVSDALKLKVFTLNNFKYQQQIKLFQYKKNESTENDETNEDGFYYDFNKIQKLNNNEEMPYFENVWVHLTCAKYSQEFFIERYKKQIYIKFNKNSNIFYENVCYTCQQKGQKLIYLDCGIQIKCNFQNCFRSFHLECARRNFYFFEHLEDSKLSNVYCKLHTPLKLRRILDNGQKQSRNQIIKFLANFESHVNYQKKYELIDEEENINTCEVTQDQLKSYQTFMIKLKEFYNQIPQNQFYIEFQSMKNEKSKYKLTNINMPKKKERNQLIIKECDPIWRYFKYKKLNKKQLYKRYLDILKFNKKQNQEQEDYQKKMKIKQEYIKSLKSKQINLNEIPISEGNFNFFLDFQEEQDFNLYCICKSLYIPGQDMIFCEICENWYHYRCINFIGNNEEAAQLDYVCDACEKQQNICLIQERQLKNYDIFKKQMFENGYPMNNIEQILEQQTFLQNQFENEIIDQLKKFNHQENNDSEIQQEYEDQNITKKIKLSI